jgi:adenosylcobyric acid synthase
VTVFEREKTVRHRAAVFGELGGQWASLSNVPVAGYEIHHGHTAIHPQLAQDGHSAMPDGLAWQNARGNVLGLYLHGLFEDAGALHALFGAAAPTLDSTFDGLADFIDTHFEAGVLQGLIA